MTFRHSPTCSAEGGLGTPELLGPLCAEGLAGLRPPAAFSVSAGGISGGISVLLPVWELIARAMRPQSEPRHCQERPEASLTAGDQPLGPAALGLHCTKRTPFLCPHP